MWRPAVGLDRTATPVELAYVLVGGHGDEAGTRLAAALAQAAAQTPDGPARAELTAAGAGAWRSCTNRRSPRPSGAPFPSRAGPVWPIC